MKAPELLIELYPYDYRNTNDVLNVLSWQIGNAYRAGLFQGYDDIDTSFMAFLVECQLSEEQLHKSFQLIFNAAYDEKRTKTMYDRAKAKLDSGEAIRGTGTFMHRLKEMNLKEIENFSRQLQRATGKVKANIDNENIPITDQYLIPICSFPFHIFPDNFLNLTEVPLKKQTA